MKVGRGWVGGGGGCERRKRGGAGAGAGVEGRRRLRGRGWRDEVVGWESRSGASSSSSMASRGRVGRRMRDTSGEVVAAAAAAAAAGGSGSASGRGEDGVEKRGGGANCGGGASETRCCARRVAGRGVGFERKRWGEGVCALKVRLCSWLGLVLVGTYDRWWSHCFSVLFAHIIWLWRIMDDLSRHVLPF